MALPPWGKRKDRDSRKLSLELLTEYHDDPVVESFVNSELSEIDLIRYLLTERGYLVKGLVSAISLKSTKMVTLSGPLSPVATVDRLPGRVDCSEEGLCWLSTTEVEPGWVLENPEKCTGWTHWLPFSSLPIVS